MEYRDICIFLELTKNRSFTKTAKALFVSQSTVSTKLKLLEEELGCKLFQRFKGQREITITQEGKEFIPIAQRWKQLFEETALIKQHSSELLRIAVVESVYYEIMLPFTEQFMERHPNFKLSLKLKDSDEVYELVHHGLVDYGFAAYVSNIHDIISVELYEQVWCILSYEKLTDIVDYAQIDSAKYLAFSGSDFSSLDSWRSMKLSQTVFPSIEINSLMSAIPYMRKFGYWCIATVGYARRMLAMDTDIHMYKLDPPAPPRKIYLLEKNIDEEKEIKSVFKNELLEYIFDYLKKEKNYVS